MIYHQRGGGIYREGSLLKRKKKPERGFGGGAKGVLIKLSSTCIIFIKHIDSTALGNQLQTLKTHLFSQIVLT